LSSPLSGVGLTRVVTEGKRMGRAGEGRRKGKKKVPRAMQQATLAPVANAPVETAVARAVDPAATHRLLPARRVSRTKS
jgi:hypothetical protein